MKKLNGFRKMMAWVLAIGMVLQCIPALGETDIKLKDYFDEINSLSAVVNEIDENVSIDPGSLTVYDGIVYLYCVLFE